MNEMDELCPSKEVPLTDSAALMAIIARAATDPSCDLDKMERLIAMQERALSRWAEWRFASALSKLQAELPSISERGDAAGRYSFPLWEDINTAIKPFLCKHGFSLSFGFDFTAGITVTGALQHVSGHKEATSVTLPADTSGNKNAVQAVGSSLSYGKRYTASALLNLTSHGEDDDAYRAAIVRITEEQEASIHDMLESTGADKAKFLKWLKVDSVSDIPAAAFDTAIGALRQKAGAK